MRIMSVKEAANEFKLSTAHIYHLIRKGKLRAERDLDGKLQVMFLEGEEIKPIYNRKCVGCGRSFKTDKSFKIFHNYPCRNRHFSNLYARRKRPEKRGKKDRDAKILTLRKSGMSYGEIGKLYGLTRARIQQIIAKGKKNG